MHDGLLYTRQSELEPFYLYNPKNVIVYREDKLVAQVLNRRSSANLIIVLHMVDEGGVSGVQTLTKPLANSNSLQTFEFEIGAGIIQHLSVRTDDVNAGWQECFIQLSLMHYSENAGQVAHLLVSGCLVAGYARAYGDGMNQMIADGPRQTNLTAPASPVAGADFSYSYPSPHEFEVLAFRLDFTASAVVATRSISLYLDTGAPPSFQLGPPITVTAGQVMSATWGQSLPNDSSAIASIQRALPIGLRGYLNYRLRTVTTNIQAADQFSNAYLEYLLRFAT